MNTKSKLADISLAELQKQKSTLTGILIGFGIIILVASGLLIYFISKGKNVALIAVIPGCMVTLLPALIRISQLNAEIKSRNTK
jgi:hypothetical protein